MNRLTITIPLAAAAVLAFPAMASAHTPTISTTCNGVHVAATNYDASKANAWSVTIDGHTTTGTFGASLDKTLSVLQDGKTTAWSASVQAFDGSYKTTGAGNIGPCGSPPVVIPPKPGDTVTTSTHHDESCDLKGSNDTTTTTTVTHTYDAATNTWVASAPVSVTGPVVFTPYTPAELIAKGCVKVEQPPVAPPTPPKPPTPPAPPVPHQQPIPHVVKPLHHHPVKHHVKHHASPRPRPAVVDVPRTAARVAEPAGVLPNTGATSSTPWLGGLAVLLMGAGSAVMRRSVRG